MLRKGRTYSDIQLTWQLRELAGQPVSAVFLNILVRQPKLRNGKAWARLSSWGPQIDLDSTGLQRSDLPKEWGWPIRLEKLYSSPRTPGAGGADSTESTPVHTVLSWHSTATTWLW